MRSEVRHGNDLCRKREVLVEEKEISQSHRAMFTRQDRTDDVNRPSMRTQAQPHNPKAGPGQIVYDFLLKR